MRVDFITKSDINSIWQNQKELSEKPSLIVFGFNGLNIVSYKKELDGTTEYFHDVALLSKQTGSVVVSGLDTDTYGIFRHSAVIADRGKILGVSDMNFTIDESEFKSGSNFRVYETAAGKIGIMVGDDVCFPETAKILSLCDADYLIGIMKSTKNGIAEVMTRAAAFSNGITVILMHENGVFVAGGGGDVLFSAKKDITHFDLKLSKEYHKISTKRRGYSFDLI